MSLVSHRCFLPGAATQSIGLFRIDGWADTSQHKASILTMLTNFVKHFSMSRWERAALVFGLVCACALLHPTRAEGFDIVVKATADTTALGYTEGQEAIFTFTLNPAFTQTTDSYLNGDVAWWQTFFDDPDAEPIVSNLQGTGLIGSFDPVYGFMPATASFGSGGLVTLYMTYSSLGFEVPEGSIYDINFEIQLNGTFEMPSSYVNPIEFFSQYQGTYEVSSYHLRLTAAAPSWESTTTLYFTPTEIMFIPEPSTSAALLVIGAGAAVWQRRRRRVLGQA